VRTRSPQPGILCCSGLVKCVGPIHTSWLTISFGKMHTVCVWPSPDLQGFPDHYQFTGSIMWRHKQVGNAVPPPLAAALGSQLKAALQATAEQAA
jgi:hypothetical protein